MSKSDLCALIAAFSCVAACSREPPKKLPKQAAASPAAAPAPVRKFQLSASERKAALSFYAKLNKALNSCSGSVFSDAEALGLNNEAGDLDASEGEVCDHASISAGELKPPSVRDASFTKAARELIDSCHVAIGAQNEDNDYEAAELNDPDNSYKQDYARNERSKANAARGECAGKQYDFAQQLGISV